MYFYRKRDPLTRKEFFILVPEALHFLVHGKRWQNNGNGPINSPFISTRIFPLGSSAHPIRITPTTTTTTTTAIQPPHRTQFRPQKVYPHSIQHKSQQPTRLVPLETSAIPAECSLKRHSICHVHSFALNPSTNTTGTHTGRILGN